MSTLGFGLAIVPLLILFVPLAVLFLTAHWCHRLWRRTGDRAFLWLRWSIGLMPAIMAIVSMGGVILATTALQSLGISGQKIQEYAGASLGIVYVFVMVMTLRKLGGGCVGFRELFQWRIESGPADEREGAS